MILVHRITTFLLAAVLAAGFSVLIFWPSAVLFAVLLFLCVPLLLGRLLLWRVRKASFWIFWSQAIFFTVSALLFYLFLEDQGMKLLLGISTVVLMWLYAENLFTFHHLPAAYQAYALEYLSLVLTLVGVFFLVSAGFGAQLFLQLPVWLPAIAVFLATAITTLGVFWVSKIDLRSSRGFALMIAVVMTEFYIALSMLPTSFLANAAAFTCGLYLLLGLSRAHHLERLSKEVLRQYLIVGGGLLVLVFATARWF